MSDIGYQGGLVYGVQSLDLGYYSGLQFSVPGLVVVSVDPGALTLNRAFPTASDRRLFPIFTGRAFPTD